MVWRDNSETGGDTSGYAVRGQVFNADGSIPEDGMKLVLEQAAKEAKLTREVSLADVADLSILRQAQKELGL